jgi:protein SCO1/2
MPSLHRLSHSLLLLTLCLAGCGGPPPETGPKSYPLEGTVVAVNPAERTVTINHEEIEGFMPAMTMDFVVLEKDAALLEGLTPGDEITARLVVPDSRYWIEDLVVVKKGTPDPSATPHVHGHLADPGDELPDVSLVNQDGEAIRLSDFRGRALALTFVFTRCPLPDYCPLMMKNFAEAHAALLADESLADGTRLLTVSFDTEHDTPEILRRYGSPYQKTTPPFTQWELATGTEEAIRALAEPLGLDYVEESRSFTHNLRTAVLDPQGRLYRMFRGNDWTADELVSALREAVTSG